jgi:hypothetical protein
MEPFHSTFADVWLKMSKVEWVHEEEYSFYMLNHPARKIPPNPSAPFSPDVQRSLPHLPTRESS